MSSIMPHRGVLLIGILLSLARPLLFSSDTCTTGGIPGLPGVPGIQGRDGRDGAKGEKGQPGAIWRGGSGPQKGLKGDPGLKGHAGKRGQSGEPGLAGIPGIPGPPGPPGEPGQPGAIGAQQKAAFSVARMNDAYPNRMSVIRFENIITNINEDYNVDTGRFRCRIPGTYYFVYHASLEDRLCVVMKLDNQPLATFCDHRRTRRQTTSGSLAVYVSRDQEVWLETKDYRGMRGKPTSYSIFTGFLLRPH